MDMLQKETKLRPSCEELIQRCEAVLTFQAGRGIRGGSQAPRRGGVNQNNSQARAANAPKRAMHNAAICKTPAKEAILSATAEGAGTAAKTRRKKAAAVASSAYSCAQNATQVSTPIRTVVYSCKRRSLNATNNHAGLQRAAGACYNNYGEDYERQGSAVRLARPGTPLLGLRRNPSYSEKVKQQFAAVEWPESALYNLLVQKKCELDTTISSIQSSRIVLPLPPNAFN